MSQSSAIPAFQGTQEGEKYQRSNSHQVTATSYGEPKGAQDMKKCKARGPRIGEMLEKNDFSELRLLHLPIYSKALNSLT